MLQRTNPCLSHLNQCEYEYLKLLINPFSSKIVRAPTAFPTLCGLVRIVTTGTFYSGVATDTYYSVLYRPDMAIANASYTTNSPVVVVEYTNATTTYNTTYFNSEWARSSTDLYANNFEYRMIAAAVKARLSSPSTNVNGCLGSSYSINCNGWSAPISIGSQSVVDQSLSPLVSGTTTSGIYKSAITYEQQTLGSGLNNEWETVFWIPTDETRYYSYWNQNLSTTASNYSYGGGT